MNALKDRIDDFDTQLWLTLLWAVFGTPACFWVAESPADLMILAWSLYSICGMHWTAHLAWKAGRG